jgi:hypothetical protein
MTSSTHPITPLRQRMIDDMRIRKLSSKTQDGYIPIVRQFAGFLGRCLILLAAKSCAASSCTSLITASHRCH